VRHSDTASDGDAYGASAPDRLLIHTPAWLRELGQTAWLAVGVTLFLVGAVWLLALTQTIVGPLIAAGVIAAVASPAVGWLRRHGVPRGAGAAIILLTLAAAAVGLVVLVLVGIGSQKDELSDQLGAARDTLASWLTDVGVDRDAAEAAKDDVSEAVTSAVPALLEGLARGLRSLSSLVVFLSLTALSLFFLLMDAPTIRRFAERQLRFPPAVAHGMTQRVLESLRGYFVGVTIVAAFNALVVGAGALLLGVPLAGTIAVVTFLGAYIPYLGAWSAGVFGVLVALGGAGTDAAAGMIVVQLLANGILQQLIQPIAYGAALGIHPLAVLVVTIAAGSLFGAVGLILAAPLTAALTKIAADLRAEPAEPAEPPPVTTPAGVPA
jgi:predicted PurR-regulated permease PerM